MWAIMLSRVQIIQVAPSKQLYLTQKAGLVNLSPLSVDFVIAWAKLLGAQCTKMHVLKF